MAVRQMTGRRALVGAALGMLAVSLLAGCGWEPLYANRESGPVDAELRAIRVLPIPERIGQNLALALRNSLNPGGEPTPQHYLLRTTLQVARTDLGIQTQGFGTLGRVDAFATFSLGDLRSGTQLFAGNSHTAESFTINSNEYSDVVAEDDARNRAVEQMRGDIVNQLTLGLQRRAQTAGKK
jgi:LPS-assembly lipoprotein